MSTIGVLVQISVLEERVWRRSTVRCCSTIATGACVVLYVSITVLASRTPLCLSNCGLVSSNPSPSSLFDEMLVLCTWSLAVYLYQTQGEVKQPQQAHLSFHWIYSTIQPDCWDQRGAVVSDKPIYLKPKGSNRWNARLSMRGIDCCCTFPS